MKKCLGFLLLFSCTALIQAQTVTEKGQHRLHFGDSVWVDLLPTHEPPAANIKGYYYLPTYLRLSEGAEKQPEFMFMSYRKEGEGQDEAIMHWLFTWGLNAKQQALIDTFLITKVDSSARLLGALMVKADAKYMFNNNGGDEQLLRCLERNITSGGIVPTHADGKSATSFKFSGEDAKLVIAALDDEKKCKGISITMGFEYSVLEKRSNGIATPTTKRLILSLPLEDILKKAKTCKECIVTME